MNFIDEELKVLKIITL